MKKANIESTSFSNLSKSCAPLRVKVSIHQSKDKYYIHLDGTATYANTRDWEKYWAGFDKYAINMLRCNGFSTDNVKIKKDCYVVAFIGSLFDFLKAEK